MKENKVSAIIKLSDMPDKENDDDEIVVQTTVSKISSYQFTELSDKIKQARAEYISTNKKLSTVAEELDINEEILKKHCSNGKWNILKRNPEIKEFMLDLVDDVYGAIDVFEFGKHIALMCMKQSEFQNPKDLASLISTYKICNDEIGRIRYNTASQPVVNQIEVSSSV